MVENTAETLSQVTGIIEKPTSNFSSSGLALIGRYIFEPEIFEGLDRLRKNISSECLLTDVIKGQLRFGNWYSYQTVGKCFNCGTKEGFIEATAHYAKKNGYLF